MLSELINLLSGKGSIITLLAGLMASLVIIFLVSPLHELSHGFVANKLGDPTAKNMGRLTFNPIAHIDVVGAALIVFFGFGWAKPVPVNPNNFRNPKRDMAITALAGPVSNLIAALIGGIIYNIVYVILVSTGFIFSSEIGYTVSQFILIFINQYIGINIVLAVFNLIPFPPLDGSRIIGLILPDSAMDFIYRYERVFFMILIALMFTNVLDYVISVPMNAVYNGINWLSGLPFRIIFPQYF